MAKKQSKYIIVKNYYLDYIKKYNLNGGELLPSELEVSNKFEFSRDTVRRALNELENEGYISRERGKGTFYKKPINQTLEKKIAVLTTYVNNYIFPSIISGIEDVVSSKHYTLTLASTKNDPELERNYLRKIIDSRVNGLIIEPTRSAMEARNKDLYQELFEVGIPFVMINAVIKEINPSYVIIDDYKGGYMATKYLLQLGHRRLAGIFKKDDLQGLYRKKGFLKALREYNVNRDDALIGEYVTADDAYNYAYYYTDRLLKMNDRPTGIICYNDEISMKVIDAINSNGLVIPDDISIIGYDDSIIATTGGLKLTTIKHPKYDLGKQAASQLFNMIEIDSDNKPEYIYEPELIVRSTCAEVKD
ncbi:MAG: substrate-binding domain-containing protein [Bacillota bacterium]